MQRVARRVHGRERQPVLGEVAGEHLALGRVGQQPVEVEVRARAPRADAHLDVGDAVLGAPREGVAARQVLQTVGEQADPHQSSSFAATRNAVRSAFRSSRAASAEARTGAPVVTEAWNARSSLRKDSS